MDERASAHNSRDTDGDPVPVGTTARTSASRRNGVPVAAVVPIADFQALEDAADVLPAREAEAVLAGGEPTISMAELPADLFSERGEGAA
ncbi:hypothetical protein GCM10023347_50590 [Streptomyces chumphonensis]|uniref:Prevent-host-death family protein n=1 Tax=Streptomyces chumphonensis TaxID=1214925 RepID=A0A927F0Z2_9ACTN|nr:hypothetical protein [Streptomyces chumphonensis]MBD3933423.1 hypothetical protein [Streptomyces chumphonensis]